MPSPFRIGTSFVFGVLPPVRLSAATDPFKVFHRPRYSTPRKCFLHPHPFTSTGNRSNGFALKTATYWTPSQSPAGPQQILGAWLTAPLVGRSPRARNRFYQRETEKISSGADVTATTALYDLIRIKTSFVAANPSCTMLTFFPPFFLFPRLSPVVMYLDS